MDFLCNSQAFSPLSASLPCFPGRLSGIVRFRRCLSDRSLRVPTLPRGTVNSSGAGSKPHFCVHLPGLPQLRKCFLNRINPPSHPHDHLQVCTGIWIPSIITVVCLQLLIIHTSLIKKKRKRNRKGNNKAISSLSGPIGFAFMEDFQSFIRCSHMWNFFLKITFAPA